MSDMNPIPEVRREEPRPVIALKIDPDAPRAAAAGMEALIAFLRAALNEDERVARQATVQGVRDLVKDNMNRFHVVRHVARWEPDRVLVEVEAKRRILDRYEDAIARQTDPDYSEITARDQAQEYEDWIIPALAQPYAGRPGWREEWRA